MAWAPPSGRYHTARAVVHQRCGMGQGQGQGWSQLGGGTSSTPSCLPLCQAEWGGAVPSYPSSADVSDRPKTAVRGSGDAHGTFWQQTAPGSLRYLVGALCLPLAPGPVPGPGPAGGEEAYTA